MADGDNLKYQSIGQHMTTIEVSELETAIDGGNEMTIPFSQLK